MRLIAAALFAIPILVGQNWTAALTKLTGEESSGKVTVAAFISTQCPISNAFNDRMAALYKDYKPKGVRFVFINSNANESKAMVADHRTAAGFPFPVYKDAENTAADFFGAMATPATYVIDGHGLLRYRGYIEDSTNEARVKHRALRDALDAVLAGKAVPAPETKAFGCSIKRVKRIS